MRGALISLRVLMAGLLVALALAAGVSAAAAQTGGNDYTTQPPTSLAPATTVPSPPATPVVSKVRQLPVTGADVTGLAVLGSVLLAGGVVVLAVRRSASSR